MPEPTTNQDQDGDVEVDVVGFDRRNDWSWSAMTERWSQDRGTLLVGVAAIVAVVGSAVIAMRQNRFRPVAFPDGSVIQRNQASDINEVPMNQGLSPPPKSEADVQFELHGVVVQHGPVLVAIYDSGDAFDQNDLDQAVSRLQISSDQEVARWRVPQELLPPRFAVAAYQDHDGNGQLSRGTLGIPAEPYGFSRDARATLGRPGFDAAVVDRPGPQDPPVRFALK